MNAERFWLLALTGRSCPTFPSGLGRMVQGRLGRTFAKKRFVFGGKRCGFGRKKARFTAKKVRFKSKSIGPNLDRCFTVWRIAFSYRLLLIHQHHLPVGQAD